MNKLLIPTSYMFRAHTKNEDTGCITLTSIISLCLEIICAIDFKRGQTCVSQSRCYNQKCFKAYSKLVIVATSMQHLGNVEITKLTQPSDG